jgi:UDP-2,4-diacetamido-2,4,6-trideoxy-beta-L-altropyranose hydrolase
MNIVFRADASLAIGNGHVMRCASLAHALRGRGAQCIFVCADEPGHLGAYLLAQGFEVRTLQAQKKDTRSNSESLLTNWQNDAQVTIDAIQDQVVDWLVVDHYGLDHQWEDMLSPHVSRMMVIDDLANRTHHCKLLLDANPGRDVIDYAHLISPDCRILAGPSYALIREEIRQSRRKAHTQRETPSSFRILITLGGVDKDNLTSQVLAALNTFDSDVQLEIQVVLGPFAPWIEQVREVSANIRWPTHVAQNPVNFVELMCTQDIAIGAAGTSALERCCLGLPSINFVLAPNQRLSARALQVQHAAGLVELDPKWQNALHQQLRQLQSNTARQDMQHACHLITDGAGTARVVQEVMHA